LENHEKLENHGGETHLTNIGLPKKGMSCSGKPTLGVFGDLASGKPT
jgi:hypothetical protein